MIRIKAEYTKTEEARTTFVSKECEQKIRVYLDKLSDNDPVFSDSENRDRMRNEQKILGNILERLGYNQEYSSNGFYKITSHSFRASSLRLQQESMEKTMLISLLVMAGILCNMIE
jgi:hypothetical protein